MQRFLSGVCKPGKCVWADVPATAHVTSREPQEVKLLTLWTQVSWVHPLASEEGTVDITITHTTGNFKTAVFCFIDR